MTLGAGEANWVTYFLETSHVLELLCQQLVSLDHPVVRHHAVAQGHRLHPAHAHQAVGLILLLRCGLLGSGVVVLFLALVANRTKSFTQLLLNVF